MNTKIVQVAALQSSCSDSQFANLDQSVHQIRMAADQGAELICLQELFQNRYFCQTEDHRQFELAESIPGRTSQTMADLANELDVVIVASLFERRAAGLFHNTAVVFEKDGSIAGKYRKMHIPEDPGFYEKFYFTPGDQGFIAIETSIGKIGVCICWDQWFPEAARLTALAGAQILVYPTAIGWLSEDKLDYGASQLNAWQTVMRSHAITNGVFIVAANRVGTESNIEFWGNSFIVDPYGNVMAQGSTDQNQVVASECNLDSIETARTHWPFLRDRRIDAYSGLNRRMIDE
ncbi:MAG: carbon-nitrogen hydrolase [Mariniblastus sp.]|nr:carbon-nitrogen hydrolase [Mariniblastus sp.]